ncbi:phosphotransferase [Paenibacillus residui]|uniref:Phosphotransferase n=1 Tax=Paenibacillus residui TaxID=629724 RepID=A0ABW3D8Q2_9BACL
MGQTREIDKRHDLNVEVLEYAANRAAGIDGKLETWTGTPIGAGAGNFVTDGVYRVKGTSKAGAGTVSWSMVVKRLRPDPDRDDPAHYNYWKREALVYSSGLLERLPGELHTPVCYAVENKPDGSLWLWLEDIGEHTQPVWQKEDYAFAAAELGRFQAAFCPGEPLPVEPWLNRAWLRSWINECRKYQPRPSLASAEIRGKDKRLERIVEQFERVNHQMDNWLQAVERLPRTMAHQDFYESNLMITRDAAGQARLTVIDWQFASLSGIGEDLGRFYGLTMSRGSAPIECLDEYRELFIGSYIEGMRQSGWNGDERDIRLGFNISCAARSVWEVPKLLRKVTEAVNKPEEERSAGSAAEALLERLVRATEIQMEMAAEMDELIKQ